MLAGLSPCICGVVFSGGETPIHRNIKVLLESRGIKFAESEWAYYNMERNRVWTNLRPDHDYLFFEMASEFDSSSPQIFMHLIEIVAAKNGEERMKTRVLARNSLNCRWGQKASQAVKYEDGKSMLSLDLEPNVGPNESIFEVRIKMTYKDLAGKSIKLSTMATGQVGNSLKLPLMSENGKETFLMIECQRPKPWDLIE